MASMIFLLRRLQLPPVLVTTLSLCYCGQAPPSQFYVGRAQILIVFFERALGLVSEVNRLLSTAENDEDVVEYCTQAGLQTTSALVFLQ